MAAGMDLSLRRQEFRDERQRCSEEKNGWSSSAVEVPSPLGCLFLCTKEVTILSIRKYLAKFLVVI